MQLSTPPHTCEQTTIVPQRCISQADSTTAGRGKSKLCKGSVEMADLSVADVAVHMVANSGAVEVAGHGRVVALLRRAYGRALQQRVSRNLQVASKGQQKQKHRAHAKHRLDNGV